MEFVTIAEQQPGPPRHDIEGKQDQAHGKR
jgi:hypothetical protein